ncbi:tetratricopeptide repeat protein [Acidithiobacillus montserratensis]|uniref:Tetratricopeptide repeat protein n=1 Tax=Acidithiobacillus montserratensis TaxID=2729135 RepID=A0ACD5HCY2_9PROT|nr:tetratricopeptide repeat protein [Acidithiobacillus montserratensis]MBN2679158.1 tetratricopeptide repeat protein [Acidithiobacillaceae bacterium]MBU2748584.1 tetratricopeptide repeat protein [Acidithiobacillus montserratensis]
MHHSSPNSWLRRPLFKAAALVTCLFAGTGLQLLTSGAHLRILSCSIIANAAAAETAPAKSARASDIKPQKASLPEKAQHPDTHASTPPKTSANMAAAVPEKPTHAGVTKPYPPHKNIKAAPALSMPKPASTKTLSKAETKLLLQARAAYWRRDAPKAIADYQKLLKEAPDHPGIYGELGNVYYMTGRYPEAAIAYGSAARTMIRLGRFGEAYGLLPLIGSLNPREAAAIDHHLQVQSKAAARNATAAPHKGTKPVPPSPAPH